MTREDILFDYERLIYCISAKKEKQEEISEEKKTLKMLENQAIQISFEFLDELEHFKSKHLYDEYLERI